MSKNKSDWAILNNNLHRVLIVLGVPMLLLVLWQLYSSDKVIEVMRSNDLVGAAVIYFLMIALEIGALAFILRVGRSELAKKVGLTAVALLPFVWIFFGSVYIEYGIGVFGLELAGVSGYFISVTYSLVLVAMVYWTFTLPYGLNKNIVEVSAISKNTKKTSDAAISKKAVKTKVVEKTKPREELKSQDSKKTESKKPAAKKTESK